MPIKLPTWTLYRLCIGMDFDLFEPLHLSAEVPSQSLSLPGRDHLPEQIVLLRSQRNQNRHFLQTLHRKLLHSSNKQRQSLCEGANQSVRISPLVYAAVYSFSANNSCGQVGQTYDTFLASFAPGEVSTLDYGGNDKVPKPYNFDDLPCGPPGIDLHGMPYRPSIVPPAALFAQLQARGKYFGYLGCEFPAYVDDLIAIQQVTSVNGPTLPPRQLPGQRTKAAAAAHGVPLAPRRTPGPS